MMFCMMFLSAHIGFEEDEDTQTKILMFKKDIETDAMFRMDVGKNIIDVRDKIKEAAKK